MVPTESSFIAESPREDSVTVLRTLSCADFPGKSEQYRKISVWTCSVDFLGVGIGSLFRLLAVDGHNEIGCRCVRYLWL